MEFNVAFLAWFMKWLMIFWWITPTDVNDCHGQCLNGGLCKVSPFPRAFSAVLADEKDPPDSLSPSAPITSISCHSCLKIACDESRVGERTERKSSQRERESVRGVRSHYHKLSCLLCFLYTFLSPCFQRVSPGRFSYSWNTLEKRLNWLEVNTVCVQL